MVKSNGYIPSYGSLLELNTSRVILDAIDPDTLTDIVNNYLDLLDTSAAVYEPNGDYALGMFSSGWCQCLDQASRNLCGTDDNKKALDSGKWLCHESCWVDASKVSIQREEPVDIECRGGIRLYAVPIKAGKEVVGAINFGYGTPPQDKKKIREIAEKYGADPKELIKLARAYKVRTPFAIEAAKKQLHTTAKLIGEIIERKKIECELKDKMRELEIFNKMAVGRELRMAEIKEENEQLKKKIENSN
ncbi:MAG: PocR ligand-binding domain-containing protein [Candidatus Ancaeobacter aquaticus]|nr:PocR ligand-binding domain-containing protein [Candidatus Ancaeobacter aquaticus]